MKCWLILLPSLRGGTAVKIAASFTDLSRRTWLDEFECISDAAKRQLKINFYICILWIIKPDIKILFKEDTDGGLGWKGIEDKAEVRPKKIKRSKDPGKVKVI